MSALRCAHCKTNWPMVGDGHGGFLYRRCPECDQATCYQPHAISIGEDKAHSRKAHADFDRYYAEREAKLNGLDEVPLTASPVHEP